MRQRRRKAYQSPGTQQYQGEIQTMTDQTAQSDSTDAAPGVSRRSLFRAAGVGAAVVGGGALLEACSSGIQGSSSSPASSTSASTGTGTSASSTAAAASGEITIGC